MGKMFQLERNLMKTQALLLLEDLLTIELKQSAMERYDLLEKENLLQDVDQWGGSFSDKTVTVYTVYPVPQKKVWEFQTEREWYEAIKENYSMYHISGLNLTRMDSVYKIELASKGIMVTLCFGD